MAAAVAVENSHEINSSLRDRLAAKQQEAAELRAEIQQQRFVQQQLRLRLNAAGVTDTSLVPGDLRAGSGSTDPRNQNIELRSLLQTLVDNVDLSHQVVFECGSGEDVIVGGRHVVLRRMAMWQLSQGRQSQSGLKLSVPHDLEDEISNLLQDARKKGRLDDSKVRELSATWELVGTEVVSAAIGEAEPAIFLVHKETSQAVVVAKWPSMEVVSNLNESSADAHCAGEPVIPPFDPVQHFAVKEVEGNPNPTLLTSRRLEVEEAVERLAELKRQVFDLVGSTEDGATSVPSKPLPTAGRPAEKRSVRWSGLQPQVERARSMSEGDRVEVEFQGQWFSGTLLEVVEGDMAQVKCDVDSPGIVTVAPLAAVRPVQLAERSEELDSRPKKLPGHMRARSFG
eukprot:TRINITY_DN30238_c0_g1_i1.p1 TRINITY_DN30238_c0_g1~~TRINITY_DN30238_c0_g1_i1.p1  ORF type:complete len:398 (-),score=84.25 TRINITY_DN30238_c0_g1_i1:119-1312(-)